MRRRLVGVAGIVGVALALGGAGSARADVPVTQVGWWTRSPSPPAVPEGGIAVGAAPDGDMTVGAVLVDAGGGASGAELHLVESGATNPLASIQVCAATNDWSAGDGDPLEEAPKANCQVTVPMTRGDDGTWTADVQKIVGSKTGTVGMVVRPATGSVAFQLSFAPPTVAGSVSESSSTDGSTTATTVYEPSTSPSESSSSATPSFVAPVSPAPTTTAVTLATVPEDDGSSASADDVAFTPQFGDVPAGESSSDVGAATVVVWYVLALVVGAGVSGLVFLRNQGSLNPAALLARVRR